MKDILCQAFCKSLDVRSVPIGYAVRTPYENSDGDPLLVYFRREGATGRWRIEDDGTQIALLEAHGVDLGGKARGEAFRALLDEYGAFFNKDERTVHTPSLSEVELGDATVRFVGLLLRLQDLSLLSPQVVRNAWREDALSAIHSTFDHVADVKESIALSPDLVGQEADVIVRPRGGSVPPLAIFLGTSEERALHALIAKMEAEKYRNIEGQFALVVERVKKNPVHDATYSLAMARLDAVLSFRESTRDALERLARMIGVEAQTETLQ